MEVARTVTFRPCTRSAPWRSESASVDRDSRPARLYGLESVSCSWRPTERQEHGRGRRGEWSGPRRHGKTAGSRLSAQASPPSAKDRDAPTRSRDRPGRGPRLEANHRRWGAKASWCRSGLESGGPRATPRVGASSAALPVGHSSCVDQPQFTGRRYHCSPTLSHKERQRDSLPLEIVALSVSGIGCRAQKQPIARLPAARFVGATRTRCSWTSILLPTCG
jgi:hypothetical protein